MLSLFAEFAVTNNPNDPDDHVHGPVTIDPRSGKLLPHDQLNMAQKHAMAEAQAKGLAFKLSGQAAPLASVDTMVLEAKRRWAARRCTSRGPPAA